LPPLVNRAEFVGLECAFSINAGEVYIDWLPASGGDGELTYRVYVEEEFVSFAESDLESFVPDQIVPDDGSAKFAVLMSNLTLGVNVSILIVAVDEDGDVSDNRGTTYVHVARQSPIINQNVKVVDVEPSDTLSVTGELPEQGDTSEALVTLNGTGVPDDLQVDYILSAWTDGGDAILARIVGVTVTSASPAYQTVELLVIRSNLTDIYDVLDVDFTVDAGAIGADNGTVASAGGDNSTASRIRRQLAQQSPQKKLFSGFDFPEIEGLTITTNLTVEVRVRTTIDIGFYCSFQVPYPSFKFTRTCCRGKICTGFRIETGYFNVPYPCLGEAGVYAYAGIIYTFDAIFERTKEVDLGEEKEFNLGKVVVLIPTAVPIAVVITPVLGFFYSFKAVGTVTIEFSTEAEASVDTGMWSRRGNGLSTQQPTPNFEFKPYAGASVEGTLMASIQVTVYELVGAKVTADVAAVLDFAGKSVAEMGSALQDELGLVTTIDTLRFYLCLMCLSPSSSWAASLRSRSVASTMGSLTSSIRSLGSRRAWTCARSPASRRARRLSRSTRQCLQRTSGGFLTRMTTTGRWRSCRARGSRGSS
jgi:hypothetical protein